ncbi:hypothetical protein K449DRAFT_388278 [Hypoxylon sp. EC38]|nr:hypothetical protein K449DRAFT_388278 [Hypoxylon sp. EC38]
MDTAAWDFDQHTYSIKVIGTLRSRGCGIKLQPVGRLTVLALLFLYFWVLDKQNCERC